MNKKFDALVLGAGMVGAATALMLARNGYQVALIERESVDALKAPDLDRMDLRVSAISPDSQQLLAALGVWDEIHHHACDYHHMEVWHENGSARMNFAAEQIAASHLGSIVENRLVQAALLQHLSYLPNAQIFQQQQIEGLKQDDETLSITTSAQQKLCAQLLIAADGRGSGVRQRQHMTVTSGDYHQTAIVANVTTEQPHRHTAYQRFLSTGPLAFLPLQNGQSSIVWSADTGRAEELLQLNEEEFIAELSAAFEYRLGNVVASSERAGFPLNWHTADQWLSGRVLLIGDAAHGVHPLAGQGVNLGFGDVTLLRQLFPAANTALDQRRLLRRFERQRKAETSAATHLFSALKRIYGQSSPALATLRDAGMNLVDKNMLLKRSVLQSAVRNMQ
jgi:ubiquinone biosynthesis UbiH/UbiF/VisC/COQ6 family hydroxylase